MFQQHFFLITSSILHIVCIYLFCCHVYMYLCEWISWKSKTAAAEMWFVWKTISQLHPPMWRSRFPASSLCVESTLNTYRKQNSLSLNFAAERSFSGCSTTTRWEVCLLLLLLFQIFRVNPQSPFSPIFCQSAFWSSHVIIRHAYMDM